MSTNFMKRVGALGALTLIVAALSGVAPAGATIADPAITLATLTVKTVVQNSGHGTAAPDSFIYHVIDKSDDSEVTSGIFNHNGTTVLKLPPGTYTIREDPVAPYSEHTTNCTNVTISLAHPKTCTVSNIWTFARIAVTTTIDNAGGGTADPSAFTYSVVDTNDGSTVRTGTFNKTGHSNIDVPDGTYTINETPVDGYTEDFSQCAALTVDYLNPAVCVINNKFDPSSTTTSPNTSSTLPGSQQVTVHGSSTSKTTCTMTLSPALQPPSTTVITTTLTSDAFPQPHEGDNISLSNTNVSVATPADLLQTGVDLGIINAGDKIPEHITLTVAGDGTKEGSHTYKFTVTLTIVVTKGLAQPLVASASLPDTTWTPNNSTDPVFFSWSSLTINSTINSPSLGGPVTSTFACTPPNAPQLFAIAAQPGQVATTTAGGGGNTGPGGGTSGQANGGVLPVTGTNAWLWLAGAVLLIYLGLLAIGATARKRRRVLN